MSKLHIKKGDMVYVNSGNDRGKTGKVLEVFPKKERAIVEGVNIISKHTKPSPKNPQGGIIKKVPTRIGRRLENGKLVRYAKKSGEEIK